MVSKYFSAGLFLAIAGICSSSYNTGFYHCPDESKVMIKVGDELIDVPESIFGTDTISIRIPKTGLLSEEITCVTVNDLSYDGSSHDISLVAGGLGYKFVEVRITSGILTPIKCHVKVYTNSAPTANSTTKFA